MKLHTRVRFVPKSMTLNGHYAFHCTKHASFGAAYKENLNEDGPTLSWRRMLYYIFAADSMGLCLFKFSW